MNRKVGDGLLKKGGKRQRTGAGGQAREEEKRGCMLELKRKARREEAKAREQTFRFGYYVFLCIFYFFHISHVSFSMISTPFAGLLHLVIIGFIFEELELILYYILVSIFSC